MQSRIVLVSDDENFYKYIIPKLRIRKSDEVFRYSFKELPDKLHLLKSALLIINSENNQERTIELLRLLKDIPALVFGYNEDKIFEIEGYKAGMFSYFTLSSSDEEIGAKLKSVLNLVSAAEKNRIYSEMLVKKNLITENNNVFLNFTDVLDSEIEKIKKTSANAVLMAISPNEKTKFLLRPNQIETIILNNIRKNDILMNYATNKYFLLLYNITLDKAEQLWNKIQQEIPEQIFAGITYVGQKSRQQVINEVLNKLHTSIISSNQKKSDQAALGGVNFKNYRKQFNKKIDEIIAPVFYQIQQMYNDKLFNMKINLDIGDGCGELTIKSRYASANFKITTPGFTIINIDIFYEFLGNKNDKKMPESKRISLEPNEFESGLLYDLLEQFISEFKREAEEWN